MIINGAWAMQYVKVVNANWFLHMKICISSAVDSHFAFSIRFKVKSRSEVMFLFSFLFFSFLFFNCHRWLANIFRDECIQIFELVSHLSLWNANEISQFILLFNELIEQCEQWTESNNNHMKIRIISSSHIHNTQTNVHRVELYIRQHINYPMAQHWNDEEKIV